MIVYDAGLNVIYTDVYDARIDTWLDSQSRKVYILTFVVDGKICNVFITAGGERNCVFIKDERFDYGGISDSETGFVALLENENNAAAIENLPG